MRVKTTEDILLNSFVNPPYRLQIDTELEVYEGAGSENGHPGWIWVRLPDRIEGETVKLGYYTQLNPFQYTKVREPTQTDLHRMAA